MILGTVDMIGSRLLFNGYGCGFKFKPLHAGFIGQDTLLVHDEAHLEPAFQELIEAIELEQLRCHEFRRLRIMALTATSRGSNEENSVFTGADRKHPVVKKRFEARKWTKCHPINDKKQIPDMVCELARAYKGSGQAILVFLRELNDVKKVAGKLSKDISPEKIQVLTGTLRGLERHALANTNPVFARFMLSSEVQPEQGTVYLICTSAGEVGVNISGDHFCLRSDTLDSMAQRFGRVNRFGNNEAQIDVVYPA